VQCVSRGPMMLLSCDFSPQLTVTPEFISSFSGVRIPRSLIFCVVIYRPFYLSFCLLFIFFAIVVSILLRFTASDYPFDTYKLILNLKSRKRK